MKNTHDIAREIRRTKPDYVVYAPGSMDGSSGDTGNEQVLVFDGPDGSLMTVWTQSTAEGRTDQRIVFARSANEGLTWSTPRIIAGADADLASGKGMCSWGFPLVSKSGRIYVLYSRHIGVNDVFSHTTGLMAGIWSDDAGKTWSTEQTVPMPRTRWDNPDPAVPANWLVWQKPERLSEGKYFAGFTRWVSPKVLKPAHEKTWWTYPSVVSFLRFENIDDNPPVSKIEVQYFHSGDDALKVPLIDHHPDVPLAQEPSLVKLPDGRLFCVLRTTTGSPWYSVSLDEGKTWLAPAVLRYADGGEPVRHPCSPCPIYPLACGGYMQLMHNHDGHFGPWDPANTWRHRRPIYLLLGEFRPDAKQPVWYSSPKILMDNDGVPLGLGKGRVDLAMYASVTHRDGVTTLWYPDRKFFLLGKDVTDDFLADLEVS